MAMADISPVGAPAPLVRIFGWGTLFVLVAFLLNNVLSVSYDFPGSWAAFSGGGMIAWLQLGIYAVAILLAVLLVRRSPNRALRHEARQISDFNAFLVRFCFFAVLFVGVADAAIAFMRVEKLLTAVMSEEAARAMGRARDVALTVHMPLIGLAFLTAIFTRTLGFTWLALMIVIAELAIVISRFVFSYEQALMGDLVRYWYAALFLFASAYTLLHEGHVRVDVLYAGFKGTTKGWVNAWGAILLGMTTAWVIIVIGFSGKQSIINSPVANFEVSQSGTAGMYTKYQMAAFIGIFAITMLIQFVSSMFDAVADMRGEPGRDDVTPVAH